MEILSKEDLLNMSINNLVEKYLAIQKSRSSLSQCYDGHIKEISYLRKKLASLETNINSRVDFKLRTIPTRPNLISEIREESFDAFQAINVFGLSNGNVEWKDRIDHLKDFSKRNPGILFLITFTHGDIVWEESFINGDFYKELCK